MTGRIVLCVLPREFEGDALGLRASGWEVHAVPDLHAAARALKERTYLAGLLVQTSIEADALEKTDEFLRRHSSLEWVGAFDPASLASRRCRDLILTHLFDHHTLPLDMQRLAHTLGHAYGHAQMRTGVRLQRATRSTSAILGDSAVTRELLRNTRRVAKVDAPVLIHGESGSGKELTAHEIHEYSARAAGPFVAVNCGAIQASLIQSELFGHVRGAFTGADRDKTGLIEAASTGTLFLDEIGDLPRELQINLLRFLQEKTFTRVGSTRSVPVDVRVIAATNVDLEAAVAGGNFREDLFYRLNVLSLRVPPLRERSEDIGVLAEHYFRQFTADKHPRLKGLSDRALGAMVAHRWPGNVRELINRIRRAMVMAQGRLISPADLGFEDSSLPKPGVALDEARTRAEQDAIAISLERSGRNVTLAAKNLGISRMTLYRLMAKHGMDERGTRAMRPGTPSEMPFNVVSKE